MSKTSGKTRKRRGGKPAGTAPASTRNERFERFKLVTGGVIVGLAVILGLAMNFWPRLFGQQVGNPAVGIGLALLAAFRFYALRSELRRQTAGEPAPNRNGR
jgi:hypothetical protein